MDSGCSAGRDVGHLSLLPTRRRVGALRRLFRFRYRALLYRTVGSTERPAVRGRVHGVSGLLPDAALLLSIFRAGLAHREEHSPCKREAGGSSPPASTTRTQGRNRPVAGHRFGKAGTGVRSAVAAPSMHSWRNGRRSRLRSGRPRGMEVQVLPGVPAHCLLRQAAKASVPHTEIPRFESFSEHQLLR